MFNLGNSLLVNKSRQDLGRPYVWILGISLQKMFPSPGRSPKVHAEVQEGDKAEHWVSDLLHMLELPLPGASVVAAS